MQQDKQHDASRDLVFALWRAEEQLRDAAHELARLTEKATEERVRYQVEEARTSTLSAASRLFDARQEEVKAGGTTA